MAEAMVTARMTAEKKQAGNRVFEELGTNASQVVNRLYDYVIENRALPFEGRGAAGGHTAEELAEAAALVDSLRMPEPSRFAGLSLKEVKRVRLGDERRALA